MNFQTVFNLQMAMTEENGTSTIRAICCYNHVEKSSTDNLSDIATEIAEISNLEREGLISETERVAALSNLLARMMALYAKTTSAYNAIVLASHTIGNSHLN